jgi:hypothetical protein
VQEDELRSEIPYVQLVDIQKIVERLITPPGEKKGSTQEDTEAQRYRVGLQNQNQ